MDPGSIVSDFKNEDDAKSNISINNNNLFKSSININNNINNPFQNDKINNLSKKTFNNFDQNYNNSKQSNLKSGHFQRKNRFIKSNIINNNNAISDSQSIASGLEINYMQRQYKVDPYDTTIGSLKYKQTDIDDNLYLYVMKEIFCKTFAYNEIKKLIDRVDELEKYIIKTNSENDKYDQFIKTIQRKTLGECIDILNFHLGYAQNALPKIIYSIALLKVREWNKDFCVKNEIEYDLEVEKAEQDKLKTIINENEVILKERVNNNNDDIEKKIIPDSDINNNVNNSSQILK